MTDTSAHVRIVSSSFNAEDGTALYYERHDSGDRPPTAKVVIVHGMGEHIGRYQHVSQTLVSKGYSVFLYDQRGHGRSAGRRGHVNDFEEYTSDLHRFLAHIAAEAPPQPLFIIAHSMGALVSLLAFEKNHPPIVPDAMTLIGMPIKLMVEVPFIKDTAAALVAKFFPEMAFKTEIDPKFLSRNENVGKAYAADPLVLKVLTAGGYQAFLRAVDQATQNIGEVHIPVLLLHGADDQIAHPDGSRVIYQNLKPAPKQIHVYEGCYHEILNEDCYAGIIDEIHEWFHSCVAVTPISRRAAAREKI